jgi:small GTP-binding protein
MSEALAEFGSVSADQVRNFCMLAHVDHGKTTLSDFLLTANGLLSTQLAGKVRFLDSRPDEQERLITMKASCVALRHTFDGKPQLVHLVDSPGHIDFSSEVSTAMRMCDGALVVVDVIDGVTMQTRSMLRHAFSEGLRMVIVLNKLDLLISTLQFTPSEAYQRLDKIIQDCNVVLSAYVNVLEITGTHQRILDLNPVPEDDLWFAPAKGNVVFASGFDGYGFTLKSIASTWAATGKLGSITVEELTGALWGEHFLEARAMKIDTKPKREGQMPVAVAFVFEPIWAIHEAFLADPYSEEKCLKITSKLGVPDRVWNQPRKSAKEKMNAVLGAWLPLATCLLNAVCDKLPSVVSGQISRLPNLVRGWSDFPSELRQRVQSGSQEGPTVVYVAKLIDTEYLAGTCQYGEREKTFEQTFVGFGRVYSGELKPGDKLLLRSGDKDVEFTVSQLYLLRGQGLESVDSVLPGRLCGIGGIAEYITKHGVLSSDARMLAFQPPKLSSSSIVHYVLRPKQPEVLDQLLQGLRLLNKVDPQVELAVLPTGEYVMGVAGEVHGERCVEDLTTTFARVEFHLSPPIVQYRETLRAKTTKLREVEVSTPCGSFTVNIAAIPFPDEVVDAMRDSENEQSLEYYKSLRKGPLQQAKEVKKRPWSIIADQEPLAIAPSRYDFFGCALHDVRLLEEDDEEDVKESMRTLALFKESIISGFQLATSAGPMCEEPMFGVCFLLTDMFCEADNLADPAATAFVVRQAISTVAQACRQAFQQHANGQRIVEPFYECVVHSAGATQGKIYNILNRRRAQIDDEVLAEGGETFFISCTLPVSESFGLQDELRIATSGAATAQLRIATWRILDLDPYFKPSTKEEIEEYGTDTIIQNEATEIIERVRSRKGIQKRNIVENAEKQKFSMRGA